MLNRLKQWTSGVESLLYPQLCVGCDESLEVSNGAFICAACSGQLPFTQHHQLAENELTDRLAGRLRLVYGGALLYYQPNSPVQRMIHALKYYQRPDIGHSLGALYGRRLSGVARLQDLDAIVPVPLHPKRQQERGYNQAERFGAGLASILGVPQRLDLLERRNFSGSQTRKKSQERLENVSNTFVARPGHQLGNRHLLLVDDVLTTGATLDLCAEALLAAQPDLRLSVATIGIAM